MKETSTVKNNMSNVEEFRRKVKQVIDEARRDGLSLTYAHMVLENITDGLRDDKNAYEKAKEKNKKREM